MDAIIEFTVVTQSFTEAVEILERIYGYEGELWEDVKASYDEGRLEEFLDGEGVENTFTEL